MFMSKMIRDPRSAHTNRMGRTVGLVVYWPRFWDCQKHDFYISQFDMLRDELSNEEMEFRYQAKAAHRACKRKHLSYRGYVYWHGPRRRYYFYYMGNPTFNTSKWKIFEVHEHNQYTRWRDNGEQNPPPRKLTAEDNAFLAAHRKEFSIAMQRSRRQMDDYERMRKAVEDA